jgi:hypothetical protein
MPVLIIGVSVSGVDYRGSGRGVTTSRRDMKQVIYVIKVPVTRINVSVTNAYTLSKVCRIAKNVSVK